MSKRLTGVLGKILGGPRGHRRDLFTAAPPERLRLPVSLFLPPPSLFKDVADIALWLPAQPFFQRKKRGRPSGPDPRSLAPRLPPTW
jgi:hypothetical protein